MSHTCRRYSGMRSLGMLLAICLVAVFGQAARAAETAQPCALPRLGDELWLVSCRGALCLGPEQTLARMQVWRYVPSQAWQRATLGELFSAGPSLITTVFAHGNRISHSDAFSGGWDAYRALVRTADERPVRFVIFSWPSDQEGGPINDARIKAERTDPSGYCLALLLDRLPADSTISLWGHSFGARVVTSGLHFLGAGTLLGKRIPAQTVGTRPAMHAVLLVAAIDCDWLQTGHHHGQALTQTGKVLLVNNSCDALLTRYHLIYGRKSCAEALGYTGMGYRPTNSGVQVEQLDAANQVGKRHLLEYYLCSPSLVAAMRRVLLFEATTTQSAAKPAAAVAARSSD